MQIESIADLPFREFEPLALLNLDRSGPDDAPDTEFYRYGYAFVDEIWLTADGDRDPPPPVRDALLLALHDAPDENVSDRDILLEFWIDDVTTDNPNETDDYGITVWLSRFLDTWLPKISNDERAIVLAMCNRQRVHIASPPCARVPVHYADGDVVSWLDIADVDRPYTSGLIRLTAEAWHKV